MSSIPGFFSSTDYNNPCPNYSELAGAPAMYDGFTVPYVYTGASVDVYSSPESKLGFCEGIVPEFSPDQYANIDTNNSNGMDSLHGLIPGNQNLVGQGFNNHNIINVPHFDNGFDRFGDEYCCATSTFLPEFNPAVNGLFAGGQNSSAPENNQMHGIDQDSNTVKVGRYSEEERKERIERYLKKRNQRNFNKTIKYACRKTLADRRIRVRGRFARNNSDLAFDNRDDHDKKEMAPKIDDVEDSCSKKSEIRDLLVDDVLQIKYEDDEDWLQNFALCCWVDEGSTN